MRGSYLVKGSVMNNFVRTNKMEYRNAWTADRAGAAAGVAVGLVFGVTMAVREQLKNYKVWKSMGLKAGILDR